MIRYRLIKPEEIADAKAKWKKDFDWAAEPQWEAVWVREQNGEITGFVGFQQRIVVEPLWADNPFAAADLIAWVDGALNTYKEYEFQVPDDNERFQRLIEGRYGVEGHKEKPHKVYQVKH